MVNIYIRVKILFIAFSGMFGLQTFEFDTSIIVGYYMDIPSTFIFNKVHRKNLRR